MTIIARTPRLVLRTWESPEDLAAAWRIWGDPNVMAKMVDGPVKDREELEERLRALAEQQQRYGVQTWVVEKSSYDREIIGACGLCWFSEGPVYELSAKLVREVWGQGYAAEASKAAVDYGFDVLGAKKIVAGTRGEHPRAARALLRLGFVPKGTIVWPDNHEEDPYYEPPREFPPSPGSHT